MKLLSGSMLIGVVSSLVTIILAIDYSLKTNLSIAKQQYAINLVYPYWQAHCQIKIKTFFLSKINQKNSYHAQKRFYHTLILPNQMFTETLFNWGGKNLRISHSYMYLISHSYHKPDLFRIEKNFFFIQRKVWKFEKFGNLSSRF